MDGASSHNGGRVAAALVLGAAVSFAVVLLADGQLEDAALAAAALLAIACGVALLAWHGERRRADAAAAAAGRADELRADEHDRLTQHVRRLESALGHERDLLRRMRDSWKAEREWSRELRNQLQRLQEQRAEAPAKAPVHALILDAAIELVGAEKGLLLSREDEDHDGDLDFVLSRGFDNDPEHSAVAQRFAREVLERDQIVWEDAPTPGDEGTPADDEIDSLVAIPLYLRDRFHGVILCANRPGGFGDVGEDTLLALGDHAGAALHHGQLHNELRDARRSTVRVLAEAVAAHDPAMHRETGELVLRASWLARDLGMDNRERDVLVCATVLRTLGSMTIPEWPMAKPGPLTSEERAIVQLHSRLGFNILSQAPALRDVAVAVLYHHERVDGNGYPAGLFGKDIPLAARALAVLEAYGAMTHPRPYREQWTPEEACEEIMAAAGTQFDRNVAKKFVEQVRHAPRFGDDISQAILDALPLDPGEKDEATVERLAASTTDGLTLLGDQRALQQAVHDAATKDQPFGVVFVQLTDLPEVNAESGYLAGDRLIQMAARSVRRAATRVGGVAYRQSGSRLAVVAPVRDGEGVDALVAEIGAEFAAGPSICTVTALREPGESGEAVLRRARRALKQSVT